mmetsp:Transcript_13688/g.13752  ORF Transcript_13688/g.13752 Transcript_13688/m.13752 type:complete len:222 (+) Transcript_13688:297-962(+)
MAQSDRVVCLSYKNLLNGDDLSREIEVAFGYNGLGVLTVSGIPNICKYRKELLKQGRKFVMLDHSIKEKYAHPESFYSFGWSHGKEKLMGYPDISKGSYYANPLSDTPSTNLQEIEKYPSFLCPNIWPTEELPEFEPAFKTLGKSIIEVGKLIAAQCDRYINTVLCSESALSSSLSLSQTISTSICCKARFLHYYPIPVVTTTNLKEKEEEREREEEEGET